MDTLKKLTKYEKEILEGIIISIVGGWALTSILRGAYKQISNIQFPADGNFTKAFIMTIIFSIILGIIYYKNKKIAGGLMFVFIYIFLLLCAFIGYSNDWTTNAGNPLGGPCYQAILAFIAAIAFLYVKEDIYQFISELKIKRINTNIIVAIIGVLLFGFVGIVTVLRYKSYLNSTFDFGIFTQMYENMRQTGSVATTLERNRLLSHFGVHFSPIYYIALPIYFIFPSPVTVQLIQALMIALPVIPIVLIAREYRLSNWMTVGFTLCIVSGNIRRGNVWYAWELFSYILFADDNMGSRKEENIHYDINDAFCIFCERGRGNICIGSWNILFAFKKRQKKRTNINGLRSGLFPNCNFCG